MITIEKLKELSPNQIFASGEIKDDRIHLNYKLKWTAVRGHGFHDWAIYYHHAHMSEEYIKDNGHKINNKDVIKELVPCDDEAFGLYRY